MEMYFRIVFVFCLSISNGDEVKERLEVTCPQFKSSHMNSPLRQTSSIFRVPLETTTSDDYCKCSMSSVRSAKSVELTCDFYYEKDILLTDTFFPFRKYNVTSAYVLMKHAKSAIIKSEFLSSLMDSPSTALDIWHCGKVVIESTPELHPNQLFTKLKTFVGVGIVNCSLEALPSFFLRDRSRGAFRLRDCVVGRINSDLFHNIEEVRYLNFENTIVREIAGPLSSSGVITLSKRELHSWDGILLMNSTIDQVAPSAFNVTHKTMMEQFVVKQSTFGKVGKGGIAATGDIDVLVTNSSFFHLDSFAIQASVTGQISFSNNVIETYVPDSLFGLNCNNDSILNYNTFYVQSTQHDNTTSQFRHQCGTPNISYVFILKPSASHGLQSATSSVITIVVLVVLFLGGGMLLWSWKNRSLFRYHYQRSDIPLWRDESPHEEEEEPASQNNSSSTIVHNPTLDNEKILSGNDFEWKHAVANSRNIGSDLQAVDMNL